MSSMKVFALWVLFLKYYVIAQSRKKTDEIAIENISGNDVQLVGIMGIHKPSKSDTLYCEDIIPKSGVLYLEGFRYAISLIRKQPEYLFGARLGYTVFDSCKSTSRLKWFLRSVILRTNVIGIVGPSTSDEAVFSSPVLGVFNFKTVSYRASSSVLDNRGKYDTFYRTVPSDRYLVQALVDVLQRFNWTYVAIISSSGYFGHQGVRLIKKQIENLDICLSRETSLPEFPNQKDYVAALTEATTDERAKVVILYTDETDSINLIRVAGTFGTRFQTTIWLSTTQLAYFPFRLHEIYTLPGFILSLSEYYVDIPGFKEYFKSLSPQNNPHSYFLEFWQKIFNCSFLSSKVLKTCSGNESLTTKMAQFQNVPVYTIMRSVFMFASAFRKRMFSVCISKNKTFAECPQRKLLLYNNFNSFQDFISGKTILVDKFGGTEGIYDILYYNKSDQVGGGYFAIGQWNASREPRLDIYINDIEWENGTRSVPNSLCGKRCVAEQGQVREYKGISRKNRKCCWACKSCHKNAIVINDSCLICDMAFKPDTLRQRCIKLPVVSISYQGATSMISLISSAFGILLTSFVLLLFFKNRKSSIVKASGKELCYIILIGIALCFLSSTVFLAPPSVGVCGLQRFVAGFSLCVCYSPLLFKTNRIYRIFKHAKRSALRPSFISPISQVLITNGISGLQILFGIVWIVGDVPTVLQYYPEDRTKVLEICRSNEYTMVLNLAVCLVLMMACTFLAFKTRHFPKYYNEAQSIGITMYISCFLWGVFLPIFLFSSDTPNFTRTVSIAIFCNVIAYVTLFGLFLTKVYFILASSKVDFVEKGILANVHGSESPCKLPMPVHSLFVKPSQLSSFIPLTDQFKRNAATSTDELTLNK